jgi:transposase
VFVFRGKRGDLLKLLWWDGDGLCLFAKRLERGKFTWPQAANGTISLTPAQLSMLLEGILEYVPARFKVIRQVRPKLACGGCERIVQAEAPSRPIARGVAEKHLENSNRQLGAA